MRALWKSLIFMGYVELSKNGFVNYLSNRKPYVDLKNNTFSMQKIECGIPQGMILGPGDYYI